MIQDSADIIQFFKDQYFKEKIKQIEEARYTLWGNLVLVRILAQFNCPCNLPEPSVENLVQEIFT